MKRLVLTLWLALSGIVCLYAGGIATSQDLIAFAAALNAGQSTEQWRNADGVVCLEADIDMAKAKKFAQIKAFGGQFDGCGHALLNWKAQRGMFGEILQGGEVRNLRIDASCVMKASNKAEEYAVGFIADKNSGIVRNCENFGTVNHKSGYTESDIYVGGLVGINRFVIMNCKNHGAVNSETILTKQESERAIYVGGIAGGAYAKTERCPMIVRCENLGAVTYEGDAPICHVGGIVGSGFKMPVKYCINRGEVNAVSILGENIPKGVSTQARVAGIVAFTKGDVMCCDNFGAVNSSGSHAPNVAGVCAMPHAAVVVGDCVNYGTVKMNNDAPGSMGGISGGVNRAVRIRGCVNRGEIVYAGMSADRRTSVGGVVGSLSVRRTAESGGYLRNCVNYGKVSSGAGGNHYENNNAIHTGGVAGWVSGSAQAKVIFRDCANHGEVSAAGGRRGNLCGACVEAESGGEYPDLMAESAEPMGDGSTIFGRVTASTGEPVSGVVVSDCVQCVETDGYGYYAMKSDLSKAKFVYLSVPAAYEVPMLNGQPAFFRRIARYESAVMANFTLERRKNPSDKYTVLMVADPQMRPYGVDNSAETFRDDVAPDIEAFRATAGECYSINLGDLVYNYMVAYDDYLDIASTIKCPTFNVMGNHDYDQNTLFDTKLGTVYFETYVGPTNYSFNIGKVHYVVLNNIIYNRTDSSKRYSTGLEEESITWLENDLSHVSKDMPIVVCSHSQLFKKRNTHSTKAMNHKRYTAALTQFKHVYSWAGHNHENYSYHYAGKGYEGKDKISSILVARATGALRLNKYISADGTPQGYMVMNVDGENMSWYYKAVGCGKEVQMRLYAPLKTDGRSVVANIWNYGDGWSKAEWWENGVKVADMEQFEDFDPDYNAIYANVTNKTTRKYCKPQKSPNMFKVVPSAGVTAGEVRVTDNFGNVYTSKIAW